MRSGIAVHDTDDPSPLSLSKEKPRVILGIARVNDNRQPRLGCNRYLGGKSRALGFSRRVVVVVVETALTDRDGGAKQLAKLRDIALLVESGRIMGMDARGSEDEAGVFGSGRSRESRHVERLSDADDSRRARIAGAGDYRVAVAVERRVREVGVAVDEVCRAPVWRGHLRSIQRSTGAAT
jgi:hypothetical protein